MEITHIARNVEANSVGERMLTGFAQVAESKKVSDYMVRGKEMALKHGKTPGEKLIESDVPSPSTWDSVVSESTTPPFSDKLMMFHVIVLIAGGMANYGVGMAISPRRNLAVMYACLIKDSGLYAEDGANISDMKLENPQRIQFGQFAHGLLFLLQY
jgi:hypothetical protein